MANQDNRSNADADPSAGSGQALRQKAEAITLEGTDRRPEDSADLSPEETRKTLHELRVHQVELEMQNEELRAAQAEIEAARARYFDLYELAPVGYCTLSEQGLILEANLTAATLLGTSRGRLIKQPISRFIFKDDQDIYYLHRKNLFETGEPQECELRLVRPDAALFWAHLSAIFVPGDGSVPVCRVTISNITKRKRAEEALRKSEERLRTSLNALEAVLEAVPAAVWIADDPECSHIRSNRTAIELLRLPEGAESSLTAAESERPAHFRVRRDGRELRGEELPVQRAARGFEVRDFEEEIVFADGDVRILLGNATPLWDERGKACGAVAAFVDITERKRSEQELRRGEDKLRASLGEKEVLLQEVHHRVKNNMQVISSLVALQADESQDAAVRSVLQDVTHRVRSMALVHEKLYQTADLAHVEFAEYTRSLLHYLSRAHGAEATGLRITLDLEPVSLPVHVAVPCGLILNELVGNALKHAFRDRVGGVVAVSLRDGPKGQVSLRVSDNGRGLPAGFDWRRSRSLGLRLVQMLAGQIHAAVEASNGEGTAFTITFEGPKS